MAETVPDGGTLSLLASGAALLISIFKPAVVVSGQLAKHEARIRDLDRDMSSLKDDRRLMVEDIKAAMNEKFTAQEKLFEARLKPVETHLDRLASK